MKISSNLSQKIPMMLKKILYYYSIYVQMPITSDKPEVIGICNYKTESQKFNNTYRNNQ